MSEWSEALGTSPKI